MLANVTKTEGLQLGKLRRTPIPSGTPAGIEWCREGSYIVSLGAPIGNNFDVRAFWMTKSLQVQIYFLQLVGPPP